MKQILTSLLLSASATLFLSGCTNDLKTKRQINSTKAEAELACETWKEKGGTWQMKIDDFRISAANEKTPPEFPIKVQGSNDTISQDQSFDEGNKELTFYLPILSSGRKATSGAGKIQIETIDTKWLTYDVRLCELDVNEKNVFLGKEYLIKSDSKLMESKKAPALEIKKRFPFYK